MDKKIQVGKTLKVVAPKEFTKEKSVVSIKN
jgi:hypothetical protein